MGHLAKLHIFYTFKYNLAYWVLNHLTPLYPVLTRVGSTSSANAARVVTAGGREDPAAAAAAATALMSNPWLLLHEAFAENNHGSENDEIMSIVVQRAAVSLRDTKEENQKLQTILYISAIYTAWTLEQQYQRISTSRTSTKEQPFFTIKEWIEQRSSLGQWIYIVLTSSSTFFPNPPVSPPLLRHLYLPTVPIPPHTT